jgi:hypothetical protein
VDRHTPRLGRLRSSSFIDHCDSTVDLGPSQHRCLANIPFAGTKDPHVVCEGPQLGQTIAGDDLEPVGIAHVGKRRMRQLAGPQLIQHRLWDHATVGGCQSIQ